MGKAIVTFTMDTRLCQGRFDFGVPALFVKCYFCVEEYAVGAEFLCILRYDCGRLGKESHSRIMSFIPNSASC